MATNIKVGIDVNDNGSTGKVIKSVESLNAKLTETAKTAAKVQVGGTASSRKLAYATPTGSEVLKDGDYNKQRAATEGGTGAAARDFAKQAQGLGGVVRLYATYAANIFAAGAAFRALSDAMNTTNMVKGLDQLGAASGQALGTLSKDLVKATDGALSMRQAMQSVVQATSSGMSSKNIMRMGEVAKRASQALGIDLADSMSRITRAATKLEPELVDELGLFTKTGKAADDYAKSIGKTTSQLTDFERRMAYSNALLAEGEKKFGAIEIDTNPYTKLVASVKDLAQSGLELLNKVLVPIVDYLSKSPTALAVTLASIGGILLKQAIPAIGEFKAGLASAAEDAKKVALRKAADAGAAMAKIDAQVLAEAANFADSRVDIVDAAEKKVEALQKAGISKASKAYKLLQMDIHDVTRAHVEAVEARAKVAEKEGKTDVANTYREVAKAVWEQKEAEEAYQAVKQKRMEQTKNELQQVGAFRATMEVAAKAQEVAAKKQIISNAAYNGSLVGISNAMLLMNSEIAASDVKFTKFGVTMLKARGFIAAVGGTISTLAASISSVLNVVGIFITAFTIIDSIFSGNSEQISAFNDAVKSSTTAITTLTNTLDTISKKDPLEAFNADSLSAKATAVTNVADTVANLVTQLNKADADATGWDRFLDGFKIIWGGDLRSKFSKSMADTVLGSLNKLGDSAEALEAKKKIAGIIGIDVNATKAAWANAFAGIADDKEKTEQITKAMLAFGVSLTEVADKSKTVDNSLKASIDVIDKLILKFKPSNDISMFGDSLIKSSIDLAKAMDTPEHAVNKLADIIGNVKNLSLFGAEDQVNLIKYTDQIKAVSSEYQKQKSVIAKLVEERANLLDSSKVVVARGGRKDYSRDTKDKLATNEANMLAARKELLQKEVQLQQVAGKFSDIAVNQFVKGAKYVETAISAAFAKASQEYANSVLGAIGDLPGVSEQRTKLALQQISAETNLLKAQLELITATKLNTATLAEKSAQDAVLAQEDKISKAKAAGDVKSETELKKGLPALNKTLQERQEVTSVLRSDTSSAAFDKIKSGIAGGNNEMRDQASELLSYVTSINNLSAQIASQADKASAAVFAGKIKEMEAAANAEKKRLDTENKSLDISKQELKARVDAGTLSSNDLITETKKLDLKRASNDLESERLSISNKIDILNAAKASGKLSGRTTESVDKEIARLNEELAAATRKKNVTDTNIAIKAANDLLELRLKEIQYETTKQEIVKKGIDVQKDAELERRQLELDTNATTSKFVSEYLDSLKYELEVYKTNEEAKRKQDTLTAENKRILDEYNAKYKAQLDISGGKGNEESARLKGLINAQTESYERQKTAIDTVTAAKLANADATYKITSEQNEFNRSLDSLKGLDSVFTGLGSAIADVAVSIRDMDKNQKAYINTLAALEESKLEVVAGSKEEAAIDAKIAKTKSKQTKDELSGYAKTAGAAKKMFKEKTAAYKAFSAVEKAAHVARLAMDIKEMATKLFTDQAETASKVTAEGAQTAATFAGTMSRIPAYIAEIYGKSIGQLGPIAGPIVATGLVALMLAALGKGGGGGGNVPTGITSEQRQETQGTGQDWRYNSDTGKYEKYDTGGGVFGDSSAKSDSVNKSLEVLKDNSVIGLSYDNKMLRAMEKIADSITGAAKAIYATPGIRTGTNFGTLEGQYSKGGFGSSIPIVGKALGSIFGGGTSSSTTIQGAGIQLRGTISQLADATDSSILQYKDLLTKYHKSGGWFSSSKDWSVASRETNKLEANVTSAISDVFKQSKDLFSNIAQQAGITTDKVTEVFDTMDMSIDIDLMGLKGDEVLTELNAAISSKLDMASATLFSMFDKYKNFGEGMLETATRVIDTNIKVAQAIDNIGGNVSIPLNRMYDVTESMVKTAGSMETLLDQSNYFIENFLDDSAKILPYQKAVTKTFTDIGLAVPKNRKEFAALVQSLDLTKESSRETYQVLMNVAPSFNEVANAADDAISTMKDGLESSIDSIKSFIKSLEEFRSNLLLGAQSTLSPLEKYIESKKTFDTTFADMYSSDETVAKAARDKFTDTATKFLDASKTYFASSANYAADFDSVMSKLTYAESTSKDSLTIAEQQLALIGTTNSLLGSINTSVSSLVDSMVSANTGGTNSITLQTAATGGYRQGITLVGEEGPEVVDFTNPGRVYTADQTAGMFNTTRAGFSIQPLVTEINALRKEVSDLRKDQQRQTGDIIMSNYDANQQAANNITSSLENTANASAWDSRNTVTIK